MSKSHSFLRLSNFPLYIPHFAYPFFCWWTFGLFPTFWLLWRMLLWIWVHRYLFESLLSIRLSIYPGVELLGHMIILCFQKNISLFTAVLGLSCSTRGWGGSSLWLVSSLVGVQRLSCPRACGILLLWPGMEPMSPALKGRLLTTGPLGKSQYFYI